MSGALRRGLSWRFINTEVTAWVMAGFPKKSVHGENRTPLTPGSKKRAEEEKFTMKEGNRMLSRRHWGKREPILI